MLNILYWMEIEHGTWLTELKNFERSDIVGIPGDIEVLRNDDEGFSSIARP